MTFRCNALSPTSRQIPMKTEAVCHSEMSEIPSKRLAAHPRKRWTGCMNDGLHSTVVYFYFVVVLQPIPVAARSRAWVCCRSLAGIAGSNPVVGMAVCLLWVLCVSSTGCVWVCVCVCVCVSLSVIRGNSNPLYTHTQVEDIRLRKKELLCTVSNLVIFTCDHDTSHFLTHVYVSMANYLHWNPATLGK